ncbi:MAG TPA: 2'-5' RNA ligase family protein [Candidatus Saccharimonadales bacterium]|jgi:ribosomal protein S24E
MEYSQKYSIVQFVEPIQEGFEFQMENWPLHVTFVDVFAVPSEELLIDELTASLASEVNLLVVSESYSSFGEGENTIPVTLLQSTPELQSLHDKLIDVLEANGAVFNSPQFTRLGFVPHATYQKNAKLEIGQQIIVKELSLIDMFVGGDWHKRKVLRNFKLSAE